MNIITMLLFVLISSAYASEVDVKLLKVFSNKREFVVKRNDHLSAGKEIFFRTERISHPKKGRIKVCKAKSCLGELEVGIFELNPKKMSFYKVSTEKTGLGDKSFYLGYGSPLGGAIRLGLRTTDNEHYNYGIVASRIDSSSGSSKVTANAISAQLFAELYESGNWKFNLVGELGWAFALLEFENEVDELSKKENVYMLGGSVETLYQFGNWSASVNIGVSMNGFKSSYQTENGEFTNPYGKVLVFSEFGVHYNF